MTRELNRPAIGDFEAADVLVGEYHVPWKVIPLFKIGPGKTVMCRIVIRTAILLTCLLSTLPCAAEGGNRLAEPTAATQRTAEAAIKAVFKEDYAAAQRDAGAMGALASKLLQLGIAETKRAAECYVCLREARDLGARAGNFKTVIEAIDKMAEEYDVDALDTKATLLETVRRALSGSESIADLTNVLLPLVDEAVACDRYEVAIRLASTLEAAAEKSKSTVITSKAKERKKWLLDLKAEYARTEKERATLARDPADSAANLAVGRFLCLWKDDWTRGLPLLDRGSEATLNTLAAMELEPTKEPVDQAELADRWWARASKETGALKPRMQKRAIHWYATALPGLEGLARARVEKLVGEYRVSHPEEGPKEVYVSDLAETEFSVAVGTLGKKGQLGYAALFNPAYTKIVVNGKESPNGISMHPPVNGSAHATYDLAGKYRTFGAEVALDDADLVGPRSSLTFKVVGDGKTLWSSKPVGKVRQVERCQVRVAGVKVLRLEVECPGSNHRAHAVWIEPRIEPW